jgi:hypothetical protein
VCVTQQGANVNYILKQLRQLRRRANVTIFNRVFLSAGEALKAQLVQKAEIFGLLVRKLIHSGCRDVFFL